MTSTIETEDVVAVGNALLAEIERQTNGSWPIEMEAGAYLVDDTLTIADLARAALSATPIERLREENARLRDALKPFADFANHQDAYRRGDNEDFCSTIVHGGTGERSRLTCGDLRKARVALNQQ